jgi:hypothetical protein
MKLPGAAAALFFTVALAIFVPTPVLAEPQTGIEGVITIAPAKPGPVRADGPGSVPLANATWVVKDDKGIVAKNLPRTIKADFRLRSRRAATPFRSRTRKPVSVASVHLKSMLQPAK